MCMKRVVICVLLLVPAFCGSVQTPHKRVMIDAFHSLENVSPENNMVALSKVLPDYSFETRRDVLTYKLMKEYDVVVLYQPYNNLEDSEIEAVLEFVRKGGGLIICGEHDVGWNDSSRSTYNRLGKNFGTIFTSNAIDDPTDKMGCYCTPIIHNLAVHPLTEGVTQIVMYKPCALRLSETAIAVAWGDDDTRTVGQDKITGEEVVVAAVSVYERGKILVVGSHTAFDDSYIDLPDNLTFSVNAFQWVSEPAYFEEPSQNGSEILIAAVCVVAVGLGALIFVVKKKQK